jgi:hypothetical protein
MESKNHEMIVMLNKKLNEVWTSIDCMNRKLIQLDFQIKKMVCYFYLSMDIYVIFITSFNSKKGVCPGNQSNLQLFRQQVKAL